MQLIRGCYFLKLRGQIKFVNCLIWSTMKAKYRLSLPRSFLRWLTVGGNDVAIFVGDYCHFHDTQSPWNSGKLTPITFAPVL
jgi:hypothetical protein